MRLIKKLNMRYPTKLSTRKSRYGDYQCPECLGVFQRVIKDYKLNTCSDCSTHGGSSTRLYRTWISMKSRCGNENSPAYKHYGGRGITVCGEWESDFRVFRRWAQESGYHDNLTIDRINNDIGYSSRNCRWATMDIQNQNTRLLSSTNTSGFRGVSFSNRSHFWVAAISIKNKTTYIGSYGSAELAAVARDKYVCDNSLGHTLNFTQRELGAQQ